MGLMHIADGVICFPKGRRLLRGLASTKGTEELPCLVLPDDSLECPLHALRPQAPRHQVAEGPDRTSFIGGGCRPACCDQRSIKVLVQAALIPLDHVHDGLDLAHHAFACEDLANGTIGDVAWLDAPGDHAKQPRLSPRGIAERCAGIDHGVVGNQVGIQAELLHAADVGLRTLRVVGCRASMDDVVVHIDGDRLNFFLQDLTHQLLSKCNIATVCTSF
mmetsp:Transcript_37144/g.93159  ORF Transcript_37144/g.93159 Transcript_37144/m.93159 type:complete len:219 (+) Transcript_37144:796-1452(+)